MPSLKEFPASETDNILTAVAKDGACIALNTLSLQLCDDLIADFEGHLEQIPWGTDELVYRDKFYGEQTKRLHGLFSKSTHMCEVLTNPLFLELSNRLFVESGIANDVRLSNCELMVLNKDQENQEFHTDGASWRRVQKKEEKLETK